MRNHVIDELMNFASKDDRAFFVTADLGFNVVEKFRDAYPDRYLNVGISEQNMCSVAAGLALEGYMAFTYSIGNFPTLRGIEQIRNNICYHNANVKIMSVGGGFAYGDLGMTHHATEDIAMMRALPNMRVYVPSDEVDAVACFKEAVSFDGPAFIRMARGKEAVFHEKGEIIDPSKLQRYTEVGSDINIITCGTLLGEGRKLHKKFEDCGIDAGLFSILRVKPLCSDEIKELAKKSKLLITMEEHNVVGGVGGAVAEALSEIEEKHAVLYRAGLQDTYTSKIGNQDYLRDYYGMNAEKVFAHVMETYKI